MEIPVITPEFAPKLLAWLKATKAQPKYSRKLANFVKKSNAWHIFKVTYTKEAPSYLQRKPIPGLPENRYDTHTLYITDQDTFVAPGGRPRGTELRVALSEGGSSRVYTRSPLDAPEGVTVIEDVTLAFWERYMQEGKCVFDHPHTDYGSYRTWDPLQDEDRFRSLDAQTVQCRWCGDVMHMHRTLQVRVYARAEWKHDTVTPDGVETFRCSRCHRRHPIADYYQNLETYGREVTIPSKGVCPSCFLAITMANHSQRKSLMPL